MIDMVIHFKSVSNCTSEQLTRTFAVLVQLYLEYYITHGTKEQYYFVVSKIE